MGGFATQQNASQRQRQTREVFPRPAIEEEGAGGKKDATEGVWARKERKKKSSSSTYTGCKPTSS
jgi:hypothetical protein